MGKEGLKDRKRKDGECEGEGKGEDGREQKGGGTRRE